MENPDTAAWMVVIPGDGVGPEVVDAALAVVSATGVALAYETRELGQRAVDAGERSVPPDTVGAIRSAGVALKGPVATPGDGSFRSPNLELKRQLGTTIQIREVRSFARASSETPRVDLLVVRETSEGLFAGRGLAWDDPRAAEARDRLAALGVELPVGAGFTLKFATEQVTRRLWETACDVAKRSGRTRLTAVAKAAAIPVDQAFVAVGRDVVGAAGLEFESVAVDTVAAQLVQRPSRFEVLVATNLYGDIVSDVAGAVAGSVGLVSGRNLGEGVAVFEAAHGCAFRHAGRDTIDPIATMLSAAGAVEQLGHRDAATAIRVAVQRTVDDGVVTGDLAPRGRGVGTAAFTEAVTERVERVR